MKIATRFFSTALMTAMVVTSSVSVYAATPSVIQNSQVQHTNANISHQIVINGELVSEKEAPVYVNQHQVIMVPLRVLAEKLDYQVTWNQATKSVELSKGAQWSAVTLGKDQYNFAKMSLQLGTAPEARQGITYVPLAFAEQVLKTQVQVDKDGKIMIDELMHALSKKGTITKVTLDPTGDKTKGSILVNGYANGIVLYINSDTVIVDQDNKTLSINDLTLGGSVEFVHDDIMTMSLPPMTGAKKIVVKEKEATADILGTAGEVSEVSTLPDGSTKVRIKGEKLNDHSFEEIVLTLAKETPVIDAKDQQTLTAATLKKGDKVYGFYGPQTTKSLPPMGQAIKVVVEHVDQPQ